MVKGQEDARLARSSGSGGPRPDRPSLPGLRLAGPPSPAPQRHLLDIGFYIWRTGHRREEAAEAGSPQLAHPGTRDSKALGHCLSEYSQQACDHQKNLVVPARGGGGGDISTSVPPRDEEIVLRQSLEGRQWQLFGSRLSAKHSRKQL